MITIYDSLSRRKLPLRPLRPPQVRMYVCGVTVYDLCHVGHARVMVVFDMVSRYLRYRGYEVSYVRNITDIDDKIIRRAGERDEPWEQLTARYIEAMHEDAAALGVAPPDQEPRATAHMAEIVAMIERLLAGGFAYRGEGGDVYFEVSRFEGYGRLSGRALADLRAGARVEVAADKRDPLDFVLWKTAKPGEPAWSSPWGPGRPGWHIECSAMSTHCLGSHFDIHGGGMDLKFPHHENEIAQSEAATGEPFASLWMHNGFVQIDQEKMAKSTGNFVTIRDALAQYPGEVLRYLMLASHYRSPLQYAPAQLQEASQALERLYGALRDLPDQPPVAGDVDEDAGDTDWRTRFEAAMDDDFNTPLALSVLFDLARQINRDREAHASTAARRARLLRRLAAPLGLLQQDALAALQGEWSEADRQAIEAMVEARSAARARRDWAEADRLRDALAAQGIELEDGGEVTRWRRASGG